MLAISSSLALAALVGMQDGRISVADAYAAPPAKHLQEMTYQVYAGGINAVRATLDVDYESKDRYSMELFATTQGFLGKIVPWEGTFETHGWRMQDGTEKPELHKSTAIWQGEEDVKEYTYGKDGSFKKLHVIQEDKNEVREDLEEELVQGTTDVLTAALQAMKSVADSGVCEGTDEVFDGKRRFKMVFRHKADDVLTPTEYNVYEGVAARCEVEVIPVSGAWHKKPRGWASIQEQGRDKGSLPTVWLAKIDNNGPAVPVKMRVKTNYGTLFMHLVGYKNGEKRITAKKEES
ncbi:MAG: DUF3108 domain-containing protein [Rhodospirillales bacterium]|nr:DUF3108 domain-containing protein [Rhodospirillales bacterium]MCB9997260.1 DUF3108 domain-containing protein [Rhodospirillales bacterium]